MSLNVSLTTAGLGAWVRAGVSTAWVAEPWVAEPWVENTRGALNAAAPVDRQNR
jgi:hypothetical protein